MLNKSSTRLNLFRTLFLSYLFDAGVARSIADFTLTRSSSLALTFPSLVIMAAVRREETC